LALACVGCSGTVDLSPIETALVAGSSIGHAASIAVASMSTPTACANVTQACSTFPCDGAATLALGPACPLPLGGAASGSVGVGGTWSSQNAATLMLTFIDVGVSAGQVSVREAAGVAVQGDSAHYTVAYSGQDVSVSGSTALVGQSTWTVDVDTRSTPGDPSDDVYSITGGMQGTSTRVTQVELTNVVLDPGCRSNPISGSGVQQAVGRWPRLPRPG
jgi:hypothetical protein